jgi:glycosyltransferase involved in cell wall biosynthesis
LRLLAQWPINRLLIFGPKPPEGAETLKCRYHHFQPMIERLQYSRFAPLAPPLSWLLPFAVPDVEINAPAVVLSVMQTSIYYRAAAEVAWRYQLPLALVIHDDPEEIEPVRWWTRPLVRKFHSNVYQGARVRFCVSPQMQDELSVRYNAPSDVLYPSRSQSIKPRAIALNETLRRKDRLVIGYGGSIKYGYGERLEELLPEFQKHEVTLRIYSLQEPWFLSERAVEYAGPSNSPDTMWQRVKEECDAVILPYCGPEHGHQSLYRTHFPSKLPEYLALGMPIVITGPEYATGVQWGNANPDAAVVVPVTDPSRLGLVLGRLRADGAYRAALARGAVRAAAEEFDPARIGEIFRCKLQSLVDQ